MESSNNNSLLAIDEIQLSYKSHVNPSTNPKVDVSADAYEVFQDNWDDSKIDFIKQFKVLLLNSARRAIGIFEVSSGSSTKTIADPRLIFVAAIKANACAILTAQNHPSGNLRPSQAEVNLTRKIRDGGVLLNIPLLDHLVITRQGHFSFADEGLIGQVWYGKWVNKF